ncbi:TIGR03016 family PEP-CTERM system-associated outer membrane protein [Massilia sp. IC2-278]|uniref:TIGR03016 family PEP-CTERM system-associated outer membrane protein n=1 Tax=Massilia sp. IC2-278 TaxID=2887200 RepID=UPI001E4EE416|nr:TIGR03016 family PEP-CTERM system-associated outer membrane protein [Massilia sp. IC2-278]MCC2959942.1 TIGR03016 family PEP-CTERM system-associated outer membrane protein [Massilia sp. IC2-278]
MTITTAKRSRMQRSLRLAPLRLAPLAALLAALPAHAEWKVTPSISLTESYSDNVNQRSDATKRSSWITEATPAIAVQANSSRVQLNANARAYWYDYSEEDVPGVRNSQYQYDADSRFNVVDQLFYVDAGAGASSRSISAFGPLAEDPNGNRYTSENQTDVKTWRISPYLTHRFGTFASGILRYSHDSVKSDASSVFGNSTADGVVLDIASGTGFRNVGWNVHVARQNVDNENFGDTSSQNATLGLSYRVGTSLNLTATGGYDKYDYQALGGETQGASWSVGFGWAPSPRTNIQMSVGRHYLGNTGSLMALHRSRHSTWKLGYSDAVTTTRSQFSLPAAIDTASMLDSLFMATIPDPVLRRQAVDAYILAAGLPSSLADNINYLTNRYMRQKLLQASSAFNWRHSSAVLSAYASERTALSSSESDSGLLGSQLRALNDSVRQTGLTGSYSYRLSARSTALASLSASHSRSLDTDLSGKQNSLRLGLTHRFGRSVRGSLELRRTTGDSDITRRDYTENAVSATVTVQL